MFKWPNVFDIWNTYLTKFIHRYVSLISEEFKQVDIVYLFHICGGQFKRLWSSDQSTLPLVATSCLPFSVTGMQGSRSGESTHPPPMWPWFDSQTRIPKRSLFRDYLVYRVQIFRETSLCKELSIIQFFIFG